ncbi:hypothetical protein DRO34_02755 [Candidatus Bathyarchaeota archaeon]|nr:MAG: hypothetical protein DRO34_02755 [Candidatus Bathyarchaeota archaeon]
MQSIIYKENRREHVQEQILKAIDKALTQVFGKEAVHIIYHYLEENHKVRKDEIVDKLEKFTKGLEEFLSTGAYPIEKKILEDIYSNYGLLRRLEYEKQAERQDFVNQVKLLITST